MPRLLLRIYRNNQRERGECVGFIADVDGVGVGPVEELLGDHGFAVAGLIVDLVVPFKIMSLNVPALVVDGEAWREKGEFLAHTACVLLADVDLKGRKPGKELLLYRCDLDLVAVEDLEAFAPGKLTLDDVDGVARLVVNVVAVKPRKSSLFK